MQGSVLDDIELPKRILALLDEKPVRLQWRLDEFRQVLPDLQMGTLKTAQRQLHRPISVN
ncbi:MAG: hypothetical protein AB7K71_27505 [Polyangiaceae bacterium]